MTINYSRSAATAGVFTFIGLLFRWKGSVWRATWLPLFLWITVYYILNVIYRFLLVGSEAGDQMGALFKLCAVLSQQTANVLCFALGFYVVQIYGRWWSVFMMLPYPDSLCFKLCAYLRTRRSDRHEEDRMIRKTMLRYVSLAYVLVMRDISERIRKRFPTIHHLVPALLTKDEEKRLCLLKGAEAEQRIYWIPLEWTLLLLKECSTRQQIDYLHYCELVEEICDFRLRLHNLMQYDSVNVPLTYTQVVHLSVIAHFVMRCFAAQPIYTTWNERKPLAEESTFPIYSILEFIFFYGWLNVAQVMLNPFGMDHDDFDIDTLIERNLIVSYSAVDNMFDRVPNLVAVDQRILPHTLESRMRRALDTSINPMKGSCSRIEVQKDHQRRVHMASLRRRIQSLEVPTIKKSDAAAEVSTPPVQAPPAKVEAPVPIPPIAENPIAPPPNPSARKQSKVVPNSTEVPKSGDKPKENVASKNSSDEGKPKDENLKLLMMAAEGLVQMVEQKRKDLGEDDPKDTELDATQYQSTMSRNPSKRSLKSRNPSKRSILSRNHSRKHSKAIPSPHKKSTNIVDEDDTQPDDETPLLATSREQRNPSRNPSMLSTHRRKPRDER